MNSSGENTLTTDLWHKREFTDVVFHIGGREFPAHKIVLASQSEYFRVLLFGDMKEASMSSVNLPEEIVPAAAFERVLQYSYTRSLDIDEPLEVSECMHSYVFLQNVLAVCATGYSCYSPSC